MSAAKQMRRYTQIVAKKHAHCQCGNCRAARITKSNGQHSRGIYHPRESISRQRLREANSSQRLSLSPNWTVYRQGSVSPIATRKTHDTRPPQEASVRLREQSKATADSVVEDRAAHVDNTSPAAASQIAVAPLTLPQRLARLGLRRQETRGDGNCFFHALESLCRQKGLRSNGLPQTFAQMRQSVCDYIDKHYEQFSVAIECEYGTRECFQKAMRRNGTHADGTVANAACLMFDIDLHIHTLQGVHSVNPAHSEIDQRPVLDMIYIPGHYEATQKLSV